jgi:2'-5' RNA ligase
VNEALADLRPFRVDIEGVEIFEGSQVIYLALRAGFAELERLHDTLNTGCLHLDEPFVYHPHITVAQQLAPELVGPAMEMAARRWREFAAPRSFTVDRLVFVQNTVSNRWMDLVDAELGTPVQL